jgi:hypothetical protein
VLEQGAVPSTYTVISLGLRGTLVAVALKVKVIAVFYAIDLGWKTNFLLPEV